MVLGYEGSSICFVPSAKFGAVGKALFIYLDMQDRKP